MRYAACDLSLRFGPWAEQCARYVSALLATGSSLRAYPLGKAIVRRDECPEEFHDLLDTMRRGDTCSSLLFAGELVGAIELIARGEEEYPADRQALVTWPTSVLPQLLVDGLNAYRTVIVPSEACRRVLEASGVRNVVTVCPPDPPVEALSSLLPGSLKDRPAGVDRIFLAVGSWQGVGNLSVVLHSFVKAFKRDDRVLLHMVCSDAPVEHARDLAWECSERPPEELPLISVDRDTDAASSGLYAQRAKLYAACDVYVSATRRLDYDPVAREAWLAGMTVIAPASVTPEIGGGQDDGLLEIPYLVTGAAFCDVPGVTYDQTWGDPDAAVLEDAMREARAKGRCSLQPRSPDASRSPVTVGSLLGQAIEGARRLGGNEASGEVLLGEHGIRFVIPHKDHGPEYLGPCLEALMPQLGAGDRVLVVDQESGPGVLPAVRKFCDRFNVQVQVTEGRPDGVWSLAKARNDGARYILADPEKYLLFLDCDCVVPAGFVEKLRSSLISHPGAVVVPRVRDLVTRMERPATGLAGMSRDLFDSLHGYDEGYYGYGSEDIDFLWRARRDFGAAPIMLRDDDVVIQHMPHPPVRDQDEHAARNEALFFERSKVVA